MILDEARSRVALAELWESRFTSSPNNKRLNSDFWLPAMLYGTQESRFLSTVVAHLPKSPKKSRYKI